MLIQIGDFARAHWMPEKVKLPTQKPIDFKAGSNQALTKDPISISDGGKYQFLSYFF